MGQTRKIALTVNGKRYEEEVEVRVTLADGRRAWTQAYWTVW